MNDLIQRLRLSRFTVALCFFGCLSLVGVVGLREFRAPPTLSSDALLQSLRAEREGLTKFSDVAVQEATARTAALQQVLWTPEQFLRFKAKLPAGWSMQELPRNDSAFTASHRYLLTRPNSSHRDWREIRPFLESLGSLRGAAVQNLSVVSSIQNHRFDELLLTLGLSFQKPKQKQP